MEHFPLESRFSSWAGLVPECKETLQPGMVVTLEPAVYYPGKFGIRLENNYLITENGYERLCNLPLEKEEYILKG